MNTPPKSVDPAKPPLGLWVLRCVLMGVVVPAASLISFLLLLISNLILLVPTVAFQAWLILQAKRKTLKSQWKLSLALFVASLALSRLMLGRFQQPEVYLLQQGYVGWFRVRWSIPGAAPLLMEDGHYLMSIPADGLLNTSTVLGEGRMRHTYYYIDKVGQRNKLPEQDTNVQGPMVWEITGSSQEVICFVGTNEQFMHAGPDKNGGKPKGAS